MKNLDFDYEIVKNPTIFRINCLEAHSDNIHYKDFLEKEEGKSSFYHSLNGIWKFAYAKNYDLAVQGFEKDEYNAKSWDSIRVPAHIQMEGYDIPQYANVQYPWEGHEYIRPGQIPTEFNPVASYVKYFTLPSNMEDMPINIAFCGVESAFALWLNGKFIGYHEDSFTKAEFDLSKAIRKGENKLAVQVFKFSSSSWCEDQDFFRFSGIYRDVYLYTYPKTHILDVDAKALLDENIKNAKLELDLKIKSEQDFSYLSLSLKKDNLSLLDIKKIDILGDKLALSYDFDKVELWSAEDPNLYELNIAVYDKENRLLEIIKQDIGFRRFELKDGLMLLNGKRIVFKGVNRHDFSSKFGRSVTKDEIEKDIITMKRNNINAIRTSHYPNNSYLYELCDRYGLYLIDENNMETHGSWNVYPLTNDFDYIVPKDNKLWEDMLIDRAKSMLERDKNHASILIWSCGNESYGGSVIYEMSQYFRNRDKTRLVHYEGVFNDRSYNDSSDMESQMYPSVEKIEKFLEENKEKPFICCEYTHAMGNSCGAMHKYTDLSDREPRYQGGFIWDYIDQSITKKNRYGEDFEAYGGDFGDRPCDYNFSGNGIVYGGNREASPKMQEVKFNYQNISLEVSREKVIINNKNLFVNTNTFACIVKLEKEGKLVYTSSLDTDVEALRTKEYKLELPELNISGEYVITISFILKKDCPWAMAGHEVAFGQAVFNVEAKNLSNEQIYGELRLIESVHNIGIKGDEFEAMFSVLNGGLVSYKYAGKEMLDAIPRPNFWRAPTDNDIGNLMPQRYAQWKIASKYLTHRYEEDGKIQMLFPSVEKLEDSIVVKYKYLLPTTPASTCLMSYEVFKDGKIKTSLEFEGNSSLSAIPEFGVLFKMNADYDNVEWYGLGESESYIDRKRGAKLGVYKNKVEENMAKYLVPQECGNKEEVRYAKITDAKGRGLLFSFEKEYMSFSALPYTPEQMEEAMHAYELTRVFNTVIRVNKTLMGVGGDDSWGAKTHKEYLIPADKKIEFSFSFKGI